MSAQTAEPPTLSLCVPTFNRAAFLRDTLERIARQISGGIAPQVEIVVSDNASTDDTPQVIAALQAAFPLVCLRSHRQTQNTGPDANIYETVKLARGEFAYILSDDDILLPGAVTALLNLIKTHPDLDAFALNIRSFGVSVEEPSDVWFPVSQDTVLRDRNETLAHLKPMFLSVFAFRRHLAMERDHTDKTGTFLLQSYLFMDVLAEGRGTLITAQPFLAQRKDNTAGWPFWHVMTTNFQDLLAYARQRGFSASTLQQMQDRHLKEELFVATRHYKLTGRRGPLSPTPASYRDGIRRLLRMYGPRPFLLFVFIPLLLLPSGLLQGMRRIYKRIKPSPAFAGK